MQPKYIKYKPKSKYIVLKRQLENKEITYESIVDGNKHTKYFWKYYKHYHNLNISPEQMKKYKKTYNETRKDLENKPISVFNKFVDAWIEDDEFEESTLGPDFSMAVCEYFKTHDNETLIPYEWFIEAAIRDMIYDLFNHYDDENFNKLKKLLKKNNWIQTHVTKNY